MKKVYTITIESKSDVGFQSMDYALKTCVDALKIYHEQFKNRKVTIKITK